MEKLNFSQKTNQILDNFIEGLKTIYDSGLISVILYGSAASGEFIEKGSNINLLVVLDNANLENLSRISGMINRRKFRIIKPVFFSEGYIRSSLDVFPIEFLDIKENYSVLLGKDVLRGLEISIKNLRFQCEHELKAKLLSLKSGYLGIKDRQALKNLLFKSLTSIVHVLRNLLRLKGKTPPYLKEALLKEIGNEFRMDMTNFNKILKAKQKNLRLGRNETESLFFGLAADLEKIIDVVDTF